MLVKTIISRASGKKWEVFKESEDSYYYNYYEFFKQIGWKLLFKDADIYTKDAIEFEFGISL